MAMEGLMLVAMLAACVSATQPGIEAVIYQKGFDYLQQVGIPLLQKQIGDFDVPEFSGTYSSVQVTVNNIHCAGLTIGSSTISPAAPSGLAVEIGSVGLSCTANWKFREKVWPHPWGSGTVTAKTADAHASVAAALSLSAGVPTVSAQACTAGVHVSLSFHDSNWDWVFKLFKGSLESAIDSTINKELCSAINKYINDDANKWLSTYSLDVDIPLFDKASEVDFSLVAAPTADGSSIDFPLKGEVFQRGAKTEAPFEPSALPAGPSDRMLTVALGAYALETLGWSYMTQGLLQYTVQPTDIPESFPLQFNTTDFSEILPDLYNTYPDLLMQLATSVVTSPLVSATAGGLNITTGAFLVFNVIQDDGSITEAFSLNAEVLVGGDFSIDDLLITGKLTYLSGQFSLNSTTIGPVDLANLQETVDMLLGNLLIPYVNTKLLGGGFPLPSFSGVGFTNSVLLLEQDAILVSTDVTVDATKAKMRIQ